MTISQHIRQLFQKKSIPPSPVPLPVTSVPIALPASKPLQASELPPLPIYKQEPLPDWLADEDTLRDEGVLFGLSTARPDDKTAQIRSYFARQIAPLDETIDEQSEKIGELNLFIEQRENQIQALNTRINECQTRQPQRNNLIRTAISLPISAIICISNFYLIDETLRPAFPNRWVAVGIFLAGMFNLFGRTSFFYEESARLSARRIVAEMGLPLAASDFVLVYALPGRPTGQAFALFAFVLFLFLLAGNLLLSLLTTLQTDLAIGKANRLLAIEKHQSIPVWQAEITRLTNEVDTLRAQKWPIVAALNHVQAERTRLNTRREELVNLFMSEYELARNLRERLSEQERKLIFTYK